MAKKIEFKASFKPMELTELKEEFCIILGTSQENPEQDPLMQERMIQFYGSTIYYLSQLEKSTKTETP